jgi:peptidoglycan/xylan/chitin deacetylase (PgdA/CDA1 family)
MFFLGAFAKGRSVAITVDDLPYVTGDAQAAPNISEVRSSAEITNRTLVKSLKAHRVPVTAFVIQKRVESVGLTSGTKILKEWISRGFDLGNHTYSHPDINNLSSEQIEEEITHPQPLLDYKSAIRVLPPPRIARKQPPHRWERKQSKG